MSNDSKRFFETLGSKDIWNLRYRCAFAFVGISGQSDAHERISQHPEDRVCVT